MARAVLTNGMCREPIRSATLDLETAQEEEEEEDGPSTPSLEDVGPAQQCPGARLPTTRTSCTMRRLVRLTSLMERTSTIRAGGAVEAGSRPRRAVGRRSSEEMCPWRTCQSSSTRSALFSFLVDFRLALHSTARQKRAFAEPRSLTLNLPQDLQPPNRSPRGQRLYPANPRSPHASPLPPLS